MNTNGVKPTLDEARARVARAEEHIASLEREIITIAPPKRTITAMVAGPAFLSGATQLIKAPPIIPILIGETIYNLRTALDYLVYQLFNLDTGQLSNRTKFPIEDTEKSWDQYFPSPSTNSKQLKKMWLHRLTTSHKTAIKRLQPCFGNQWTATLRDLSNPDKHRHLIAAPVTTNQPSYGAIAGPVMVTFEITSKVAFEDTTLVMETLDLLQQEVADVIEAFDPDFK